MTSYNVTCPDIYDAKTSISEEHSALLFILAGEAIFTGKRGFRIFLSYGGVRLLKWINAYSEAKCGWI